MALPSFDELPRLEELSLAHSWGVFGPDDELGTINLLTSDRVRRAARLVRDGVVVNLTLPLTEPDPPLWKRQRFEHCVFWHDRNTADDRLDGFYLQGSSQWDALRHIRAREHGFYGGVTDDPGPGSGRLGIDRWAEHGIVGRGVLLDLQRRAQKAGVALDPLSPTPVPASTLAQCADEQGVELRAGDVLCVRFGWVSAFRALSEPGRHAYAEKPTFAGLSADEDTARFLWDAHVAAVVVDNPAVEDAPGDASRGSLHRRLIPMLGLALGELFDLDRLAELSAADGRYEFLFVGAPLNLPGGVGSPANALAIR
jgi:kynurenine formamidase